MRAAIGPIGLLLAAALLLHLSSHRVEFDSLPKQTLHAKVTALDRNKGEIELTLTIQPKATRFLFEGEVPRGLFLGDWIDFSITAGKSKIRGTELKIKKIVWETGPENTGRADP